MQKIKIKLGTCNILPVGSLSLELLEQHRVSGVESVATERAGAAVVNESLQVAVTLREAILERHDVLLQRREMVHLLRETNINEFDFMCSQRGKSISG